MTTKKSSYSPAQARASRKWNEENYERIELRVPPELKRRLLAACALTGQSQHAFCIAAIEDRLNTVGE